MELSQVAPAFVEMAHQIVWAAAATVDTKGRPRSRVLHPIWEWDGTRLTGWIATSPESLKAKHMDGTPFVSLNYWTQNQDTCLAECKVSWETSDEARHATWDRFVNGPAPVGYDPSMIPGWESADSPGFGSLRLDPWRLNVFPGTVLMGQGGEVLTWQE